MMYVCYESSGNVKRESGKMRESANTISFTKYCIFLMTCNAIKGDGRGSSFELM